jgi:type VI secretion system secreted protein VgrG
MTFVAIPTKVAKAGSTDKTETIVFRPRRITPKPMVPGIVNAKIDDSSSGDYAELDDNGSYKCRTFSDLSETAEGKGSRFVRQAQDYAGAGMGSHFPAHKGTEVIFIFTEGDPNRPIIVGQVPNTETATTVSGGNQTQCKTVTGGGNSMTYEDSDGGQRIALYSPVKNTHFTMGAPPAE